MNILFLDQFGQLGGAQQCLLALIPEIIGRGWKPFAIVPANGELAVRLESFGVRVTRIPELELAHGTKSAADIVRFAAATPILARRVSTIIREHAIDLLYVNGPRMLPAAALGAAGIPILFHAHNVPSGGSRSLLRWAARRSRSRIVAVSKFVATTLFRGFESHIIPNGVPDLLLPKSVNTVPRIGILGRIAPEKGQLAFVEAARLLPGFQFTVCGEPSHAEYAHQVRARAASLPIDFIGWQDDIGNVLAGLDLLVVPSLGPEGFGRTVIEGFSAMTPVIAFPSGGITELIKDGETGYLVNPQTPAALAARISEAWIDRPNRDRIARTARALWAADYTQDLYRSRIMEQIVLATK